MWKLRFPGVVQCSIFIIAAAGITTNNLRQVYPTSVHPAVLLGGQHGSWPEQ